MDVLPEPTGHPRNSECINDTQIHKDLRESCEVTLSESIKRNRNGCCNSKQLPEDTGNWESSKLKLLFQTTGQALMASVPRDAPMNLTSRWSPTEAVYSKSHDHDNLHNNISTRNHKRSEFSSDNFPGDVQMFPLDLSCKYPPQRSTAQDEKISEQRDGGVHNGKPSGSSSNQSLNLSGGLEELLLQVSKSQIEQPVSLAPSKEETSFDPLFILSQVACEKLDEMQSSQTDKKIRGKSKTRPKKSKKGQAKGTCTVRKSKKKDTSQSKPTNSLCNIDVVENGQVILEKGTPGFVTFQTRNQGNKQNGFKDNQTTCMFQAHTNTSAVDLAPSMVCDIAHNANSQSIQSSDYLELNQMQKNRGTVDGVEVSQVKGDVDKMPWPFTCRTCHTRFKNAAFLKIHEKIAHENKMARTDPSGNHISFVKKDNSGNKSHVTTENRPNNPFPIHWKKPKSNDQPNRTGFAAIPCILKIHRQTSTSEMSSSVVKIDKDGVVQDPNMQSSKDRQYNNKESATNGRHVSEIHRADVAECATKDVAHQRQQLDVDGTTHEIKRIKEKQEQLADNSVPLPPSNKVFQPIQHKFFLQISDRSQSGEVVDSTVKIESGMTQSEENSDGKEDGLKKKLIEGPNQIRVPTSLAVKFIPGDSNDSKGQPGYQHKVYLRIVDGGDSSIRIKTGSMNPNSSSRVGSTAVKIESTYMDESSRHNVSDVSRPHKCHYCPKYFPSISALTAHERIHTGEKPYECRFCGRAFYHQNDRRKHERIHTGEKPYQCSICGQKFTNKGQVKIHERNHTGERPYQCRHCHKCFKSISNVNRHEKIHTGLKPYTCPVCHRGFSRREHVRTHEEICRKKMLEEDEELADDPIDMKLPYFRKIAIRPSGVPESPEDETYQENSLQKRTCTESADLSYYSDGEHWSVRQIRQNEDYQSRFNNDRSSSEEELVSVDGRSATTDNSPKLVSSSTDKMSHLLYNSGPSVEPQSVSSSSSHTENTMLVDSSAESNSSQDVKNTSTASDMVSDEVKRSIDLKPFTYMNDKNPATCNVNVKRMPSNHEDVAAHEYVPCKSDATPNSPKLVSPLGSTKLPVHCADGPMNKISNECQRFLTDKSSLHYIDTPTTARPPVVQKNKSVSDKLSAHIEALAPSPEQPITFNSLDPAKKEPRFYICGSQSIAPMPTVQKGISEVLNPIKTKESSAPIQAKEDIPQNEEPKVLASMLSDSRRLPVAVMYKASQISEKPVVIPKTLKSTIHYFCDDESPPVLVLANSHDNMQKLVSEKSALDEPPKLSGPHHLNEILPKTVGSPVNIIPPLLERSGNNESDRLVIDIKN